jgi:hypothetical protein
VLLLAAAEDTFVLIATLVMIVDVVDGLCRVVVPDVILKIVLTSLVCLFSWLVVKSVDEGMMVALVVVIAIVKVEL